MLKAIQSFGKSAKGIFGRIGELLEIPFLILCILAGIALMGLIGQHMAALAGREPNPVWHFIATTTLSVFGYPADGPAFEKAVGTAMEMMLVVVTLLFAALPI